MTTICQTSNHGNGRPLHAWSWPRSTRDWSQSCGRFESEILETPASIRPSINIVEAHNIILGKKIPALHFDHDQFGHALIFEPVFVAGRNKGGFVDIDKELFLANHDLSYPVNHDPVFAAMLVHLQGQRRTSIAAN